MTDIEHFKDFAESCIPEIAKAIKEKNFKAFSKHFDPALADPSAEGDFMDAIEEEQDGLGLLQDYHYLGHVKGNQEEYPDSIRFVYSGVFSQSEGLIILSVHERDGQTYLNEHVYYWG